MPVLFDAKARPLSHLSGPASIQASLVEQGGPAEDPVPAQEERYVFGSSGMFNIAFLVRHVFLCLMKREVRKLRFVTLQEVPEDGLVIYEGEQLDFRRAVLCPKTGYEKPRELVSLRMKV